MNDNLLNCLINHINSINSKVILQLSSDIIVKAVALVNKVEDSQHQDKYN